MKRFRKRFRLRLYKFTASSACLLLMILPVKGDTPATAASDWMLSPFIRPDGATPVIKPDPESIFNCPVRKKPVHWEALHTFNPAACLLDGKVCLLYRAEDDSGNNQIGSHTSRLGLAESDDGLHFTKHLAPVFYPDSDDQKANEWDGGCEDPRLVADEHGLFILTYTQWNHQLARLAIATSRDLVHWKKHGPAFAEAYEGRYAKMGCKSATIVGRYINGQLTAQTIHGQYWMYWGEGDMHFATSTDLIHWSPLERSPGKLRISLNRRAGKFDSDLAEGGAAAALTDKGILVIYNGKNGKNGDPTLNAGAYSGGQALFSADDPTQLLARTDQPFFRPEMPFEKTGQYGAGTTFLEAMVIFKGRTFLYYGCADSFVGATICDTTIDNIIKR